MLNNENNATVSFQQLVDALEVTEQGFCLQVPESWKQGRTTYGGLPVGLAVICAQRTFDDLPNLRSMLINFVGPLNGVMTLVPTLLRRGKNVVSVNVDVFSDDVVALRCQLIFGAVRQSELTYQQHSQDSIISPEQAKPFTPKGYEDFAPDFTRNFDLKLIDGHRPGMGAKEGYIHCWARHRDNDSRTGIASLAALADILPPAAIPMFKQMGAISSVTWMLNILADDVGTEDGWWRCDTRLTTAEGGYSSQQMKMWNRQGQLVVEGMQSVAIFV